MIVLENDITSTSINEETVNELHADKNGNVTKTSLYHTKKGRVTPPNIISPDMMEKYEDMIHRDINENETETNRGTLDKIIEEFPYITSTAMM